MDVRSTSINCSNCTFIHNHANESGGAIATETTGRIILTNTTFVRNFISVLCTRGGGGAIFVQNSTAPTLEFENCTFRKNEVIGTCGSINFFFLFIYLCVYVESVIYDVVLFVI
jgi:predicted outer membrane repeat protein